MPFNPDFSGANDAIAKASWIFMQDWLGREGQRRNIEFLEKQGETWADQSRLGAELESKRMAQQAADTQSKLRTEFMNWAAQQPRAKALISVITRKQMTGDDASQETAQLQELYRTAGPNASRLTEDYQTDPAAMFSLHGFFDPSQSAELIAQAIRNRQSGLDLQGKYAEIAASGANRRADQRGKTIDRYIKKIGDLRSFLEENRKGKTARTTEGGITKEEASIDPDEKKGIDEALMHLGEIESRFIADSPEDPWDVDDIAWIDQNWNRALRSKAEVKAKDYWENGRKDPETGGMKFYESYDDAINDAISETLMEEGKMSRQHDVIGAPVDKKLYEASEGTATFAPNTPVEIKRKIFEVYNVMRELDKDLTGGNTFALILAKYPSLGKYIRMKEGGEEDYEETPEEPTKPKKAEAKTGGK